MFERPTISPAKTAQPSSESRVSAISSKSNNIQIEQIPEPLQASKGSGNSLQQNTKSFMESRLDANFSEVKIHTDSNAIQMNRELNASAFTSGNDIYFNSGKFSPETFQGKHLLAHELVHTIQQKNAGNNTFIQRAAELTQPDEVKACMDKAEEGIKMLEAKASKNNQLPDYILKSIKLVRQKKTEGKIKCYAFDGIIHGMFKGDEIRIDGVHLDKINETTLLHEAVHAQHKEDFPKAGQKYADNEGKSFEKLTPELKDMLRWKAYSEYWAYRSRFDLFNPERKEEDKYSEEDIHKLTLNDGGVRGPMNKVREFDPTFDPRVWKPKN